MEQRLILAKRTALEVVCDECYVTRDLLSKQFSCIDLLTSTPAAYDDAIKLKNECKRVGTIYQS